MTTPAHDQVWRGMLRREAHRGELMQLRCMLNNNDNKGLILEGVVLHVHNVF